MSAFFIEMLYNFRIFSASDRMNIGVMWHDMLIEYPGEMDYPQVDFMAGQSYHWLKRFMYQTEYVTAYVAVPAGRGIEAAFTKSRFGGYGGTPRGDIYWDVPAPYRFAARLRLACDSSVRPNWIFPSAYANEALIRSGNEARLWWWQAWEDFQMDNFNALYNDVGQYVRMSPHSESGYGPMVVEKPYLISYMGVSVMNGLRRQIARRVPTAISTCQELITSFRRARELIAITNEYSHLSLGEFYEHAFNLRLVEQVSIASNAVQKMKTLLEGVDGEDRGPTGGFLARYGPTGEDIIRILNRVELKVAVIGEQVLPSLTPDSFFAGVAYYRQNKALRVWENTKELGELLWPLLWFDFHSGDAPRWDARWGGYIPTQPDIGP